MLMDDHVICSADGMHKACFQIAGDFRFGPPYFYLYVDDLSMGSRTFDGTGLWSSDSRYFIATEWADLSGPHARLVAIDIKNYAQHNLKICYTALQYQLT